MIYQRKIRLEETDATGIVFFSKLQALGVECIEYFLQKNQFSVKKILNSGYAFPIVNCSMEYLSYVRLEDDVKIELYCEKIGNSSVEFKLFFFVQSKKVANMKLVQVYISKATERSTTLPDDLKEILDTLILS